MKIFTLVGIIPRKKTANLNNMRKIFFSPKKKLKNIKLRQTDFHIPTHVPENLLCLR